MSNEQREMTENPIPQIDLIELLRGLWRSARHLLLEGIVLTVLLVGFFGYQTFRNYTPRYQATASFTVKVANPFYAGQQYYNSSVAEQMAKTFPYILTSGVLSQEVRETLGISYMPSISARAMGNTNIFTLTVTSSDPQLALDVLNCVIEVYPSVAEFVVGPTEMTLLNESGLPQTPVNARNYTMAVIKGGVLGIGLWMCACLLYYVTHRTVNNEEQMGALVNLPCLGKIPFVRGLGKDKKVCPIITDKNDKFGFNESIRLLRVRVERALSKQNGKVLLVTSTIANEGKSTISVNLSIALAQKGKKVLLVDCDLRNPSVGGILGREKEIGLSEFLKGETSLKEVLRRMDEHNIYVLFGGRPVRNSEVLLGKKAAKELIKAARGRFDYIILDTPPCALMADASSLASLADAALLTVRQDFACRQQILEGVQMLNDSGKPIIGCVLNMTAPKLGKGSYSYYGYYGGRDEDNL